jgi:hypothetical protein
MAGNTVQCAKVPLNFLLRKWIYFWPPCPCNQPYAVLWHPASLPSAHKVHLLSLTLPQHNLFLG